MTARSDDLRAAAIKFLEIDPAAMTPEGAGLVAFAQAEQQALADLKQEGVALTKEEGAGLEGEQRTEIAMRRGENLNRYLDEAFGPQNYRFAEDGALILRNKNGKEFLADEIGITKQDIQDFADMGGPLLGAAALTAAAPPSAGVALLSLLGAVGGAVGGGIQDALTTSGVGPGFAERAKEILSERGPEAALDFVTGLVGGKVARAVGREKIPETVLGDADYISPGAVQDAAGRLAERYGKPEGSILSAAELTRAPTISRIESIAKKIPYASEKFAALQERKTKFLNNVQRTLTEGSEGAGRAVVDELQRQRDEIDILESQLMKEIDDGIQRELVDIGDSFSPGGANLSIEAAGRLRRNAVIRARNSFKAQVDTFFAAFDKLGGNELEIVSTKPLKALKRRIEAQLPKLKAPPKDADPNLQGSDALPELDMEGIPAEFAGDIVEGAVEGKVAREFIPAEIRGLLTNLANLEGPATIPQIRTMRTVVNDAIDKGEAIPGAGTYYLRQISRTLTTMLEDATNAIEDPTTRNLLLQANAAYKRQVDDFQRKGIADNFIPETEQNYVSNIALGRRSLQEANFEELRNSWRWMNQRERNAYSRSVYNDLLDRATSVIDNRTVNVETLVNLIDQMPKKQRTLLFGDRMGAVVDVLKLARAKGLKDVDLQAIQNVEGLLGYRGQGPIRPARVIVQQIRQAARLQEKRVREYQNNVVSKFLRDEVRADALNPDEFIPYMLDHADLRETQAILQKIGTDSPLANRARRAIVTELLHRAEATAGPEDVIRGLVNEGQTIISGRGLLRAMTRIGPEKLTAILGEQTMRDIRDIGIIRGGQEAVKDVSSAGGLIAGTLIPKLMELRPSAWATLAYYRTMAVILTNPGALKLFRTRAKIDRPVSGGRAAQAGRSLLRGTPGITAQMANDLMEEFQDEPELGKVIIETLTGEPQQYNAPAPRGEETPTNDVREAARRFLEEEQAPAEATP